MSLLRWFPTFLSFPLGGLIVMGLFGDITSPAAALGGGLVAGAVIGAGQWLALRSAGVTAWLIAHTSLAMGLGSAIAALITDSDTGTGALVLSGAVTGGTIGAAQAPLLLPRRRAALWALTVSAAWAAGWLVTSSIGVDVEHGYIVFGSSGALVATAITGFALRRLRASAFPPVAAGATA